MKKLVLNADNRPCLGVTAVFRDSEGVEVKRNIYDVTADNTVQSLFLAAREILTRRERRIILTAEMAHPITPSCERFKASLEVLNPRGVPILVAPPTPVAPPNPI